VEALREKGKVVIFMSVAVVLCALAVGMFGTVLSLRQASKTVPGAGRVKGIGVGIYWNSACTNQTSSIDWGLIEPGSNKTVIVYVRNEGNSVATLSQSTQNWNPSTASSYMTLSWNYTGQTLYVNQTFQTGLTLVVSPTVSGIANFSFDITITATG
jgi:hypothetical protein